MPLALSFIFNAYHQFQFVECCTDCAGSMGSFIFICSKVWMYTLTHTCTHRLLSPEGERQTIFKSKHLQRKNPLRQSCFFGFSFSFAYFVIGTFQVFIGLHIMYVCTLCFYLASVDRHLFVFW